MKLIFENWRKFLNEKNWSDYEHEKGSWQDMTPSEIERAKTKEDKDLADELFSLIYTAYKEIGGHFDFASVNDVPGTKNDVWLATDIDDDPEPDALRVAKNKKGGVKLSASGHDGSRAGKDAYIAKTAEMLSTPGHYAEMSKGIAHIMLTRHGIEHVSDPEKVQSLLGPEKPIQWLGPHPDGKYPGINGWYTRELGGNEAELKIMLGKPN